MTNKESSSKIGYVGNVKILDVEKRYKPGPKHYVYVIQVTWSNPSNLFIIYRRYAQFFDLQCKLLDFFAETPMQSNSDKQLHQIPFLPGKIILGRSQIRQIALERKQMLDEYCQTLISLPQHISRSCPILEFFHPLSTDVQQPIESIVHEKKIIRKSSLAISGPAKLETYRCLDDFTATDKLEMSLKRNNIVQVLQKHENGWWFVQNGDQTGFVPGTYLQPSELQQGAREEKVIEKTLNEIYVVNNKYEGQGQDELTLDQGSFVTVIEKSFSGWWTVKFNGMTGHFPAIYLSSWEGQHTPEIIINGMSHDLYDSDWDDDDDDDNEYHTELSNSTNPELYYIHSDFIDNTGDHLSFKRGDLIEIHSKHSSGWWFGRRMKSDHVLTWIPANFLQKEPILDDIYASINKQSSNIVPNISINRQIQEQENKPIDSIYENLEDQTSINDNYATFVKIEQPVEKIITQKQVPVSSPIRPISYNQESVLQSVKDLVKKFNGQ
ncbi:unnamed protein product [Adineta steineri]|uniref:Uncharacterized protein n=1 Tax=Adineta steineri TaxID=433720 RepID=A0A814CBL9_9BILA|nr:unnamed protein product [Adineta steineri]CAF0940301.1 unnamed protein product [Adineta steineri]